MNDLKYMLHDFIKEFKSDPTGFMNMAAVLAGIFVLGYFLIALCAIMGR